MGSYNQREKEWKNMINDLFSQMETIVHDCDLENRGYICKSLKDNTTSVTLAIAYDSKYYRSYSYQITYSHDISCGKINIMTLNKYGNIIDNKVYSHSISLEDMKAEMNASVPTRSLKDFVDFVIRDAEN